MNLTAELNFEPCKIAYISYINVIYGYYIHGRGNVIACLLEHGMVLQHLIRYQVTYGEKSVKINESYLSKQVCHAPVFLFIFKD